MIAPVCGPDWVWRRLSDGGVFAVHLPSGDYLILNRTAAELLTALGRGRAPADYADELASRFGLRPERAQRDVQAALEALVEVGLLTSTPGGTDGR